MQEALEASQHASVPQCTAVAVTARILSLTDQSVLQPEAGICRTVLVECCCYLLNEAQAAARSGTAPLLLCRALCALQALLQVPVVDDPPEVS